MAFCFAKLAIDEGLDETMRRETWAVAGARLFGANQIWEQAVAIALLEVVREYMAVGDVLTIHGLAQMLTAIGNTNWSTEMRVRGLDWALSLEPNNFARQEPQYCSVKQSVVRTVWKRIA